MSVASIENNLQQMYTMAHNAGIKVVALTMTPYNAISSVSAINSWIKGSAINVDFVADIWSALNDPTHYGYMKSIYSNDLNGLHPDSAGEAAMAQAVFAAVTWP